MDELPAGAARDEQYVVLDLDSGEPRFPGRCVICGQPCTSETQRLRSLGHFLGVSRPPVVNRVFAVPVHRQRCRSRLLLSWWGYRLDGLIPFILGGLLYFALRPFGYPDTYDFAAAVIVVLVAIFARRSRDDKMPFSILVWPDKTGAMSYIFWFKDVVYAREFSALNRELDSKRHQILQKRPGQDLGVDPKPGT